jgi:hypothetical protein
MKAIARLWDWIIERWIGPLLEAGDRDVSANSRRKE